MTAREEVLARVRKALGSEADPVVVPRAYRPAGDLTHAELIEMLTDRLLDYKAAVRHCDEASLRGDDHGCSHRPRRAQPRRTN